MTEESAENGDPLSGLAWLDPAVGLATCMGRPALFAKMLGVFLKTHAESPAILAHAAEGDPQALAQLPRMAHAIKGSVPALGLLRLGALARQIDAKFKAGSLPGAEQAETLRRAMQHSLMVAEEQLQQLQAG